MAQCVGEPSLSVTLEEVLLSAPYSFAVTSAIPSYQAFQSQVPGSFTLFVLGRRQTFASPVSVTESVSMTATRALGFQFTTPLLRALTLLAPTLLSPLLL